ncbi:hypothetical protein [Kribbella steppae]|uniref:hypothetical protein n=1 Tax=Kribbella steppae TaxID=2512223 RepID=UPI0010433E29|nr:hypothetical protein [Kribbella steppae]
MGGTINLDDLRAGPGGHEALGGRAMAWSPVGMTAYFGSAAGAVFCTGSLKAEAATGRCAARRTAPCRAGMSAARPFWRDVVQQLHRQQTTAPTLDLALAAAFRSAALAALAW